LIKNHGIKISIVRLASVGLRGFTLLSKFLLIVALAKYLEPSSLGLYGLIVAAVAYAIYPLGFEFYTYSTRELLRRNSNEWSKLLRGQALFHACLYVVFLPLFCLVFYFELLPWEVIFWLYPILVLEHVNQELSRLFIALSEQLTASVVLFFRQGAWAAGLSLWMYAEPSARNLESVFLSWLIGGLFALMLSLLKLKAMGILWDSQLVKFEWIKRGIFVAFPLFLSTLALRGIYTIDRYWFESLVGLDVLGAYVLFMAIASALLSFMDAGIYSFKYPSMIGSFNRGMDTHFGEITKSMVVQVMAFSGFYLAFVLILLEPILEIIGRELYLENIDIFYWLLVVMVIQAMSNVPHYALYAQGKDQPIIVSHLISLLIFIPTVSFLSMMSIYHAVPAALCIVQSVMLIWKTICYYRYTPKSFRLCGL
jgi:O-antigen/teichoic acid export membrane protein